MTDWREDLDEFLVRHNMLTTEQEQQFAESKSQIRPFFDNVIIPALDEVKAGFEERDRTVEIKPLAAQPNDPMIEVIIRHGNEVELVWQARIEAEPDALRIAQQYNFGAEMTKSTSDNLMDSTRQKEEIIQLVVNTWKQGMFWRERNG